MLLNCLLVDDEPLAIKVLETFIKKMPDLSIAHSCNDALCALDFLQKNQDKPIDVIFLDINMPELSGLEFLKIIKNKPIVIITSASREYAVETYEYEVFDYLLKPFTFERFLKTINRVIETKRGQEGNANQQIPPVSKPSLPTKENAVNQTIFVKENYKTVKIELSTIFFLESFREYTIIHTTEGEIKTKQPISFFEETLPTNDFCRIHKSYIISIAKIKSYSKNEIDIHGKLLPIGRLYKRDVEIKLGISL